MWEVLAEIQRRGADATERAARHPRTVEMVLSWALRRAEAAGPLYYPIEYVQFLRACIGGARTGWREIRRDPEPADDPAGDRFAALVETLQSPPAIEFPMAERLARTADAFRANVNPVTGEREPGDNKGWFTLTASLGAKGRILHTIVRTMGSEHVMELGTFWGMSGMFLLEALSTVGPGTHLTTVELTESSHARAQALLTAHYGNLVSCILGRTEEVVPELARTLTGVDFLFHDAGHSREDYVNDFAAALPCLAPGAVVLLDDIHWYDPHWSDTDPRCYEGWMEVTRHPRVRRAGELGEEMGIVLLR